MHQENQFNVKVAQPLRKVERLFGGYKHEVADYFGWAMNINQAIYEDSTSSSDPEDLTASVWQLKGYRMLRQLSEESTTSWFVCKHIASRESVAIKRILKSTGDQESQEVSLEVDVMSTVRHENLMTMYEVRECHKYQYLIFEHVEGMAVSAYLEKYGPMNDTAVREVTRQLTAAVPQLHKLSYAHMKINSGNVFIVADDDTLPLLAKQYKPGPASQTNPNSLTPSMTVKLTGLSSARRILPDGSVVSQYNELPYLAPEILKYSWDKSSKIFGKQADTYAVGVVLHELATGDFPFNFKPNNRLTITGNAASLYEEPLFNKCQLPTEQYEFVCQFLTKKPSKRKDLESISQHSWMVEPTSDSSSFFQVQRRFDYQTLTAALSLNQQQTLQQKAGAEMEKIHSVSQQDLTYALIAYNDLRGKPNQNSNYLAVSFEMTVKKVLRDLGVKMNGPMELLESQVSTLTDTLSTEQSTTFENENRPMPIFQITEAQLQARTEIVNNRLAALQALARLNPIKEQPKKQTLAERVHMSSDSSLDEQETVQKLRPNRKVLDVPVPINLAALSWGDNEDENLDLAQKLNQPERCSMKTIRPVIVKSKLAYLTRELNVSESDVDENDRVPHGTANIRLYTNPKSLRASLVDLGNEADVTIGRIKSPEIPENNAPCSNSVPKSPKVSFPPIDLELLDRYEVAQYVDDSLVRSPVDSANVGVDCTGFKTQCVAHVLPSEKEGKCVSPVVDASVVKSLIPEASVQKMEMPRLSPIAFCSAQESKMEIFTGPTIPAIKVATLKSTIRIPKPVLAKPKLPVKTKPTVATPAPVNRQPVLNKETVLTKPILATKPALTAQPTQATKLSKPTPKPQAQAIIPAQPAPALKTPPTKPNNPAGKKIPTASTQPTIQPTQEAKRIPVPMQKQTVWDRLAAPRVSRA